MRWANFYRGSVLKFIDKFSEWTRAENKFIFSMGSFGKFIYLFISRVYQRQNIYYKEQPNFETNK